MKKSIVVLYELPHVANLPGILTSVGGDQESVLIVALDREVELELEALGIPFRSGHDYQSGNTYDLVVRAEEWTKEIFKSSDWKFFAYRDVPLHDVFFSALQVHIQRMLYFTDIFANLLEAHAGIVRMVVPRSLERVSATSGYLVGRDINLAIAVARVCAEPRGIEVLAPLMAHPERLRRLVVDRKVKLQRYVFGFLIKGWNAGISVLRRETHPRILVSEYWRNIAPVFKALKEGEIVLLDRAELTHIDFKTMYRFRMRFMHIEDFAPRQASLRAEASARIGEAWERLLGNRTNLTNMTYSGIPLQPLIMGALGDIVKRTLVHTLGEIDGAYEMLRRVRPDSILLRVSVSAQTHFPVLAHVGRALGIPSIELQHGLEYLGPGSGSKRHAAEYVGVYGPIIQEELVNLGFDRARLPLIGSPRFDRYVASVLTAPLETKEGCNIICIVPLATLGEFSDSYVIEKYFNAVADAQRQVSGSHVIIKLRSGLRQEAMYREIIARTFKDAPHTVATNESLRDLLLASDVVISCYSTAVLESLQCGKPTVLYSPMEFEQKELSFHFEKYAGAGAVFLPQGSEDLARVLKKLNDDSTYRKAVSEKVHAFMAENYTFDGRASTRIVELFQHFRNRSDKV